MKYFDWSDEKNNKLKTERDVCFEDIIIAINEKKVLDIVKNTNPKYANQKILIININDYAYLVPFIDHNDKIFLKTIIPSRKATKKYIIKK